MYEKSLRDLALILLLLLAACGSTNEDPRTGPEANEEQASDPIEKDGTHEIRNEEGVLVMRGDKVGGARHGNWESYFPDGSLRSRAIYKHGSREGSSTVFHENGAPYYTGLYRNDRMVGDWLFYDREGELFKMIRYDNEGNMVEERSLKKESEKNDP